MELNTQQPEEKPVEQPVAEAVATSQPVTAEQPVPPATTPVVADAGTPAVKVEESIDVDDKTPLTFDELLEAGKEAFLRLREIPLKPLRRGVRMTLDSLFGAVDSAAKSVEDKRVGRKDKE